jgi:hypothetical protein
MLHLPVHAVLEVQILMGHTAGQEYGQEMVKGFMKLKKTFLRVVAAGSTPNLQHESSTAKLGPLCLTHVYQQYCT